MQMLLAKWLYDGFDMTCIGNIALNIYLCLKTTKEIFPQSRAWKETFKIFGSGQNEIYLAFKRKLW